ncbi:MAG: tRNA 2-selenouridine(34) synthase MnmH [Chitinophagaceae bacterium]|nr:tRNA 2-selenouridine(34) synthase MnmH [Chitinophagaceae bacterium]
MAIEKASIEKFLELSQLYPVLDVRSPGEYNHAHIPGAHNLALFTDEERKIVGTTYKQQSREAAIKTGLDYFGPKMRRVVEEVEQIVSSQQPASKENENRLHTGGCVLVHCWRGGMRSAGVAWLLDLYGFKVYTLSGGYKKFRNYVIETFTFPFQFKILGGYTGSGKTHVLKELENRGEVIVDLEGIARHKGSAFGAIGQPQQPSQEMFENILALELRKHTIVNSQLSITGQASPHSPFTIHHSPCFWLEDESQRIGHVNIPQPLWNNMRQSPVYFIDIPFEERLEYICKEYGELDKERMKDAITRIRKRLGGLETKTALQFQEEGNIKECFRILLKYYDKWYLKGLNNRDNLNGLLHKIKCGGVDALTNASGLLKQKEMITDE